MTAPSVLMVGNLLSGSVGTRRDRKRWRRGWPARGWRVWTTSTEKARLPRLVDMLRSCWRLRDRYDVAQVDVFSGPAFLWAEAVCALLRRLGKPHVLALRGGNLPAFAAGARTPRAPGARRRAGGRGALGLSGGRMAAYRNGIEVIPNAIELAHYPFRHRAPAAAAAGVAAGIPRGL